MAVLAVQIDMRVTRILFLVVVWMVIPPNAGVVERGSIELGRELKSPALVGCDFAVHSNKPPKDDANVAAIAQQTQHCLDRLVDPESEFPASEVPVAFKLLHGYVS